MKKIILALILGFMALGASAQVYGNGVKPLKNFDTIFKKIMKNELNLKEVNKLVYVDSYRSTCMNSFALPKKKFTYYVYWDEVGIQSPHDIIWIFAYDAKTKVYYKFNSNVPNSVEKIKL